jgi:hypothetical protein
MKNDDVKMGGKDTPLPCPFCGEHPTVDANENGAGSFIECNSTACQTLPCLWFKHGESESDAIVRWNRRAPVPVGWQPIETAPKDGTEFDVWNAYSEERIANVRWDGKHFVHWWIGGFDSMDYCRIERPTHWMPLPAPPKETN